MKIFQLLDAVCIALLCVSSSAYGEIITFDTSDNEFTPGVFNQGWWIESGFMFDGNDNVLTGNLGGIEHRSFFTLLPSIITVHRAKSSIRKFSDAAIYSSIRSGC